MNVDVAPSRFPSSAGLVLVDSGSATERIVAIFDGTGSWEAGEEEARAVADRLTPIWSGRLPASPQEMIRDLTAAVSDLAGESEGRPGFTFVGVLVRDEQAFVVSCGAYAAMHLHDRRAELLYRPLMWVDEQVRTGTLTEEQAGSHQFRHVHIGPLVSREQLQFEQSGPIEAGTVLLVTMELARSLLRTPTSHWSHLSAARLQDLEHDGAAHMRPVVRVDMDAA